MPTLTTLEPSVEATPPPCWQANHCRYVGNAPTNAVDPSGLAAEGHHWLPIAVIARLRDEKIITQAEYEYFGGNYSGALKHGHGGNPTYNGVDHICYSEEVEKQLRAWKKSGSDLTKKEVRNHIYQGKNWDGKETNPTLKKFNSGVIDDLKYPNSRVRPGGLDATSEEQIRSKGRTSLKRRGKLAILGAAAGGLMGLADAGAKASEIRRVFDPNEIKSKAMRNLKQAAQCGDFIGFQQSLIGVGNPGGQPSIYEQLEEVDSVFAKTFRRAAQAELQRLERQMNAIDSVSGR